MVKDSTVFLVDDDKSVLCLIRDIFDEYFPNVNLICLESVDDLFTNKDLNKTDLFIIDIVLPEIDGVVLCKKLQETVTGIPCFFISGYNQDESKFLSLDCIYDFMAKPFKVKMLIKRIRILLHTSRMYKKSLMELQEKERYFRSMMYNLSEDLIVMDKNFTIIDINESALSTINENRENVIGKKCHDILLGCELPCTEMGDNCLLFKAFETCENQRCIHERIKGNEKIWIDVLFSPYLDENSNVLYVIQTIRDITELKKTEEILKQSEKTYKSIWDLLNYSMFYVTMLDSKGIVKLCNNKLAIDLGYGDEKEMLGLHWFEFLPEYEKEKTIIIFEEILSGKESFLEFQSDMIKKDGSIISVRWFNSLTDDMPQAHDNNIFRIGVPTQINSFRNKSIESIRAYWQDVISRDKTAIRALQKVASDKIEQCGGKKDA